MRFTEKDNGAIVTAVVGKPFFVDLSSNPTTGFSWVRVGHEKSENLGSNEALRLESTYHADQLHGQMLIGGGGTQHISVTATRVGTYIVQFAYQRPWEAPGSAEKIFTLTIEAS